MDSVVRKMKDAKIKVTFTTCKRERVVVKRESLVVDALSLYIITAFHHPNLIHADAIYTSHDCSSLQGAEVLTMMEAGIGDLSQLTPVDKMKLITSTVSGLSFLHQQHILHLDIKPPNIVLKSDGQYSLIDFGISVVVWMMSNGQKMSLV